VLPHQQLVLECVEQLGRMFKVGITCLQVFFFPRVYLKLRKEWQRSYEHTNLIYGVAHIDILNVGSWNWFCLQPDFKVIKKRVEDLIAREYLERDKDNPNMFKYVA
jgi:hypothetical protein